MRTAVCLCLALLLTCAVAASELTVQAGDTLNVTVLGEKELTGKLVVASNGAITLPLAGQVAVAGKTAAEIARLLTDRLSEYVRSPQVTVEIAERAQVRVVLVGAVKAQGVYLVPADSQLSDALSAAGGPLPTADLAHVTLARNGAPQVLDFQRFLNLGDASQNPALQGGDVIRVEDNSVEIRGRVAHPGTYPVRGPALTPWDVVAEAGGLAPGANARQAVLQSRDGQPQVIDLIAMLSPTGVSGAPTVKPGDTIVIPGLTTDIYIDGGVFKPGQYYVEDGTRLLDALLLAGGVTENADVGAAHLFRPAPGSPGQLVSQPIDLRKLLNGDMSQNVQLHSGDKLNIPVRGPQTKRSLIDRATTLLPFLLLF